MDGAGDTGTVLDFVQYGVLGLVIIGFLLGWIWPRPSVDALKERLSAVIAERNKAQDQRDRLIDTYEEKVIPALVQSADVNTAMKPLLEDVAQTLRDVKLKLP